MGRTVDLSERWTKDPHAWLSGREAGTRNGVGGFKETAEDGGRRKPKTDSMAGSYRRNGELIAVSYYSKPTGFKDKWDPANQRKCHLPPSSYTTTFTDPNALFPPIDKTYIAPGGRKPTYLTPSGQTNRDADALMKRNRGAWNPDAYRPLDAFRYKSMHSLQYNKKILANRFCFHPGIARTNTIHMHQRMTEYPDSKDAKHWMPTSL